SRPPEQVGPDVVTPTLDGLFVALEGPSDGHLGRPVQLLEDLADVTFVVTDAELLLDYLGDAGTGPHLTPEPVRFRAMPEELRDEAFLSRGEFGRGPGTGVSTRGARTAVRGSGDPPANAHRGDPQRLGDVVASPALPLQVQCLKPPPLKTVSRKEIRGLHDLF